MIARVCVALVLWLAAHDRVPTWADRFAARSALVLIAGWRRVVASRSGRTCLFHPSCSARAAAAFAAHGWRRGLAETAAQLERCGGEVRLLVTAQGDTHLTTADGLRWPPSALSATARELGRVPPRR